MSSISYPDRVLVRYVGEDEVLDLMEIALYPSSNAIHLATSIPQESIGIGYWSVPDDEDENLDI